MFFPADNNKCTIKGKMLGRYYGTELEKGVGLEKRQKERKKKQRRRKESKRGW